MFYRDGWKLPGDEGFNTKNAQSLILRIFSINVVIDQIFQGIAKSEIIALSGCFKPLLSFYIFRTRSPR